MKIETLGASSELFKQVIELGNKNSATLGFIPKGAIGEKADEDKLLVAIEKGKVQGYLLFDFKLSTRTARIVHLCVEKERRGHGIAKRLFRELEATVGDMVVGIRVHCRIDYEEAAVWPKLGFTRCGTIPGRSKAGSELGVWRKDTPLPSLFDPAIVTQDTRLRVALDHNILADSMKPCSDATSGAHAVMADWLPEVITFYVTPEIFEDIARDPIADRGAKTKRMAQSFARIARASELFDECRHKAETLFPAPRSAQTESDLRHIAWCWAGTIQYFVTSDRELIQKSSDVYDLTDVRVLHPADFISRPDSLLRSAEYQPKRFSESELRIRRVTGDDLDGIESSVADLGLEGKKEFLRKLRLQMTQPEQRITQLILHGNTVLALVSWEIVGQQRLLVHLLRLAPSESDKTVALGIVNWLIAECRSSNLECLEIVDSHMTSTLTRACFEFGLFQEKRKLFRWVGQGRYDSKGVKTAITAPSLRLTIPQKYA
ncbi:MAG: GNAT family N-acetyltransferase, partial [candidate division Zixibacteria bacterium]|nr:GNAT family N-acetyltransferase [candidate division Zixibacteria bacterium]